MEKTATFLVTPKGYFATQWRHYRLNPPLEEYGGQRRYEYVMISATPVLGIGMETYIFGASARGKILNWGELPGSFRGGLDHEKALRNAGYTVVTPEREG